MGHLVAALKQPQREQRNVVLFGAGVSRHAGHIIPKSPTLLADLLQELKLFDSETWGSLPEKYSAQFAEDFEMGMAATANVIKLFPHLMRSLARYFLIFWPQAGGKDAYTRFLRALGSRGTATRTILSTLNYECLLEFAINMAGFHICHFAPEPLDGMVSIWKLHGSCSFVPTSDVQVRGADYGASNVFKTGFAPRTPGEVSAWLHNTALYPAMCMIAAGKRIQFAPDTFAVIHECWAARVTTARAVLVAGARPHIGDRHIWRPLSTTRAAVGFIGSRGDYESWLPQREGRDTSYLGGKFEEAVNDAADFISQY